MPTDIVSDLKFPAAQFLFSSASANYLAIVAGLSATIKNFDHLEISLSVDFTLPHANVFCGLVSKAF